MKYNISKGEITYLAKNKQNLGNKIYSIRFLRIKFLFKKKNYGRHFVEKKMCVLSVRADRMLKF